MLKHFRTGKKYNNDPDSPYYKWIEKKRVQPSWSAELILGQRYEIHHKKPGHWFDKKIPYIPERDDLDNKVILGEPYAAHIEAHSGGFATRDFYIKNMA